jgi:hypothetical protein
MRIHLRDLLVGSPLNHGAGRKASALDPTRGLSPVFRPKVRIIIELSDEEENARDSTRINREPQANEMDDNDSHDSKQEKPRLSISHPISTCDEIGKVRINV